MASTTPTLGLALKPREEPSSPKGGFEKAPPSLHTAPEMGSLPYASDWLGNIGLDFAQVTQGLPTSLGLPALGKHLSLPDPDYSRFPGSPNIYFMGHKGKSRSSTRYQTPQGSPEAAT